VWRCILFVMLEYVHQYSPNKLPDFLNIFIKWPQNSLCLRSYPCSHSSILPHRTDFLLISDRRVKIATSSEPLTALSIRRLRGRRRDEAKRSVPAICYLEANDRENRPLSVSKLPHTKCFDCCVDRSLTWWCDVRVVRAYEALHAGATVKGWVNEGTTN
jgi:hypothetical protein